MMENLIIKGYGCTDIGRSRSNNEDYFAIVDDLFVVADGMGGHNAGEIASKLTVDTIINFFNDFIQSEFNEQEEAAHIQQIINKAINKANQTVIQESLKNNSFHGMGTTIALALFQRPQIMHIANVGDSRAYLLRNNKLKVLTEDHSVTATMLRDGYITKEEAQKHPYRNHLTRSIGINRNIEAYCDFLNVLIGDKLLLCSDGLWNALSDNEIRNLLQNDKPPQKICQDLLTMANESDGADNITAIVISVSNIK